MATDSAKPRTGARFDGNYIGMGAGTCVGQIGGLAAALGIGVAVFVGQGVASADTGGTSGAQSSSTSSDSSTSGSAASGGKQAAEKTNASTDSSETKPAAAEPEPEPEPKPKRQKKLSASQQSSSPTKDAVESKPKTGSATARTVPSDATESTKTTDEPHVAAAPPPTAGLSVAQAEVSDETPKPVVSTPPQVPVAVVTTAISSAVSAVLNPLAGNSPTPPVESPLPWMTMAAARQEFGRTPRLNKAVDPVTTSADVEPAANVTALAAAEAPTPVVAIPQTAPLEVLQHLPIIGPAFVTPIVAFIHQIPLIGDILHPFIGYPVQFGLAPGTPVPRDVKVISFDGTPIYVHFMPAVGLAARQKAPTVLDGPGLAQPGETSLNSLQDGLMANDVVGIGALRQAGYNVVTWDPRGEWNSGGTLEVDHPDFEGKDVSAIISWLATQPEVQLDNLAMLDPRIGMVGASYGGGIQLATAVNDHRIDAIVPTIAWHSLTTALYKDQAFKSIWGTGLAAALIGTNARVNPRIYPGLIYGDLTGTLKPEDQELIDERGPDELVSQITAPTLLIQGTVDTLFTLAEAGANAKALIASGVPTKVVWYCGGHGACISTTQRRRDGQAGDDGLARPVREGRFDRGHRSSVRMGRPARDTVLVEHLSGQAGHSDRRVQHQRRFSAATSVHRRLGTGAPDSHRGSHRCVARHSVRFEGDHALNLTIPKATTTTYIIGAPQLTVMYSGTGTSRHVYAQLVDDSTGLVLGNLVTPVPVTLDGQTHTVSVPMEMVAQTLKPGESVTLQLVASAFPYETITTWGVLTVSSMTLSLPTANAAAISTPSAAEMVA
jgi:ABC-2 type transport system ATP-binding protein